MLCCIMLRYITVLQHNIIMCIHIYIYIYILLKSHGALEDSPACVSLPGTLWRRLFCATVRTSDSIRCARSLPRGGAEDAGKLKRGPACSSARARWGFEATRRNPRREVVGKWRFEEDLRRHHGPAFVGKHFLERVPRINFWNVFQKYDGH